MTTRASRTAHAPVVNTIPKSNHLQRRSRRDRGARSGACVNVGPLGWVGLGFDNIAGRRRGTRAGRSFCIQCGTALVNDPVNASANVVGYIERPIRPNRKARRAMRGALWSFHRSCETVREDFTTARCACPGEWLEDYVVTTLRVWRSIP